jgi:hypothetical protein
MFTFPANPGIDPQPAKHKLLPETATPCAPHNTGVAQRACKFRQRTRFYAGLGSDVGMNIRVQVLTPKTEFSVAQHLPMFNLKDAVPALPI